MAHCIRSAGERTPDILALPPSEIWRGVLLGIQHPFMTRELGACVWMCQWLPCCKLGNSSSLSSQQTSNPTFVSHVMGKSIFFYYFHYGIRVPGPWYGILLICCIVIRGLRKLHWASSGTRYSDAREGSIFSMSRLRQQSLEDVVVSCLLANSTSQQGLSGDSSLREMTVCPPQAPCGGQSRGDPVRFCPPFFGPSQLPLHRRTLL